MLNLKEINEEMLSLNGWALEVDAITKTFSFPNFRRALHFINSLGEIAEKHNHHPIVVNNFNKVKLILTTHSERGLTKKDFEVAKEIDSVNIGNTESDG